MKAALALLLLTALSACDEKKSAEVTPLATASAAPPGPVPGDAAPVPAPSATVTPTQIAAQHILVAWRGAERAPVGVTRTRPQARARAAEVDAKARAGGDFTALVTEYSDDPAARERMGSLGKFSRDKMDKAFSDAAFQLKVDEVSDVVETRFGFHIIKRNQ